MYSQCPDCLTRFRVTADVLRVAQGTVRCGRCGNAFNALARLSDTLPPRSGSTTGPLLMGAAPLQLQPGEPRPAGEFHFSADDLEQVFVDERDWQRKYGQAPDAPSDVLNLSSEPSALLVDETESLEDITLEGERIQIELPPGFEDDDEIVEVLADDGEDFVELLTASDAVDHGLDLDATDRFRVLELPDAHVFVDDPAAVDRAGEQEADEIRKLADALRAEEDAAAAAASARIEGEPIDAPVSPPAPIVPEPVVRSVESIAPRRWQATARPVEEDDALPIGRRWGGEEDEPAPRRGGLAWTVGALVLALVLAAQLTHYFRQDLVRHPQIGPALNQAYDRLGLSLAPNWDPSAFEIRQWGNVGDAGTEGRMGVQATIRNKAAFAQPFPLLRLELEDRFGAPVATRDFEPAEYLKVPALATRMLAAGASADAALEIADPGADAVGYRLDVCLRESAEILRCAQGPG